jgi:hypothetical protein
MVSRVILPRCPECASADTAIAYERFGTSTFSCDDCGHTWRSETRPKEPARTIPLKRQSRHRSEKGQR